MSRDLRNQLEKEMDERIQEGRSLSLKIDQNAEVNKQFRSFQFFFYLFLRFVRFRYTIQYIDNIVMIVVFFISLNSKISLKISYNLQ